MITDFQPPHGSSDADNRRKDRLRKLGALSNAPRFFKDIWRINRSMFVATIFLRVVRSALPVLLLLVTKRVIDVVAHQAPLARSLRCFHGVSLQVCDAFIPWTQLIWVFVIAVTSLAFGKISSLLESILGGSYQHTASVALMRHASTLDLSSFENPKVQDQLDRARKQIAARTPLLAQSLSQIQSSLTLFAYATGVALYAPKLIIIIVLGWIPAALCGMHFNTVSYIEEKNKLPQRRYLDYLRNLVASSAPAKEIKGYRLADYFIEQYASLSNALHKQETHFVLRRTLVTSLLSCLGAIAQLCAYLYLIVAVMGGGLSIGGFAFLVMSLLRITNLMQSSTTGLTQLASQALYLDDLYDFLSEKSRMTEALSPRPFPQRMQSGVEFRNVSFEYTGAHTHAINNVSFTLRPGEVIAFVGENGAGKSTIVKLLSRMYDATSGSILIDGADISDYSIDDIRSNIVTTHQDFIRYQLRAIDNVRFGDILDGANEERVHRSIDYASAAALIAKLKGGLRQIVGHLFEGGVGLSGGEWQKLAIARSYMGRAQIYIFDEPTASLDAKSEQATFTRIKELARGASAVIISHRFSTVRMADRIYVMDGGKIIQAGTHEQLMSTPGSYSDLFTLQAAGYR